MDAEAIMARESDENFLLHFRFTKDQFTTLCDHLRVPAFFRCGAENKTYVGGYRICLHLTLSHRPFSFSTYPYTYHPHRHVCEGRLAMLILLMKMSSPRPFHPDMERFFVQSSLRLSLFYRGALQYVEQNFSYLLKFDQAYIKANLLRFAHAIGHSLGMSRPELCRSWAFIESNFRPTARPTGAGEEYDGQHGLSFQGIKTPDGMMFLHGPIAGRRHAWHLLRRSGVLEEMDTFSFREELADPTFHIYGDPPGCEPGNKYLRRPHKGFCTLEEMLDNRLWSGGLECVKWGFQGVTKNFAGLKMESLKKVHLVPVASLYRVANIFTNCKTCLEGGDRTSKHFGLRPRTLEQYINREL